MSKISDDNIGTSPQDAYNGLVDALSHGSKNFSNLVEIEILPTGYPLPSGCNVLVHENCIGVPKLHLIQAFAVARQMFLKHQDLRNSTAVILLINPEHLTAANARKRLIQACQARSGTELHAALAEELMFTDSMLTSQLHRHTKSPTLWGHRRWLVELGKSVGLSRHIQWDLASVVLIAAERHPRNYYAWLHLRWLLQTFSGGLGKLSHKSDCSELLSTASKWCLQHPSDTSGFSFLSFCLSSLGLLNEDDTKLQRTKATSLICKEVLDFASSIRWTHESLWVFVRTLVASGEVTKDQRAAFFKHIQGIQEMQPANSRGHLTLQKAHDWCVDYEQHGELKP